MTRNPAKLFALAVLPCAFMIAECKGQGDGGTFFFSGVPQEVRLLLTNPYTGEQVTYTGGPNVNGDPSQYVANVNNRTYIGNTTADVVFMSNLSDALFIRNESGEQVVNVEVIFAGEGNDLIFLADPSFVLDEALTLYGGSGDDILWANGRANTLGATIFGDSGDDHIAGGPGSDYIYGGPGADYINGGDGDDYLSGGELSGAQEDYADYIRGGGGNDIVESPFGTVTGEAGSDRFRVSPFIDAHLSIVETEDGHFDTLEILFPSTTDPLADISNFSFVRSGLDLVITTSMRDNWSVRILGQFETALSGLDTLRFVTGNEFEPTVFGELDLHTIAIPEPSSATVAIVLVLSGFLVRHLLTRRHIGT